MNISLRSFVASIIIGMLAISFGFLFLLATVLQVSIVNILPLTTSLETLNAVKLLIYEHMVLLIAGSTLISAILFFAFSALVLEPLKKLVQALSAVAFDGSSAKLPNIGYAPTEIRSLTAAFEVFSDKAAEAHKQDSEISRVKSDFISTAAHQLRTPLTAIRWALEALEKEPLTPDQTMLVKDATDKSHDLVAIVGTLLDISSIESGKYKYNFGIVNVSELITEVTTTFAILANQRSIELLFIKDTVAIPPVRADRDRIKWVLNNLIENAIRYTPAPGKVHITLEPTAERIYIRVQDTGIGIQEKDRGNIFERFYRAGNAIDKENQGNGLGLYIARTIAVDHGGDLDFASNKEGQGTTFTLSLPVAS